MEVTNTTPVISFVLVGPQVHSVKNRPLSAFVVDVQRTTTARSQVVDPAWYLTSIEAGFEPWTHGAGLGTTAFSISRTK